MRHPDGRIYRVKGNSETGFYESRLSLREKAEQGEAENC